MPVSQEAWRERAQNHGPRVCSAERLLLERKRSLGLVPEKTDKNRELFILAASFYSQHRGRNQHSLVVSVPPLRTLPKPIYSCNPGSEVDFYREAKPGDSCTNYEGVGGM